jgi:Zn-dependent protease with chaperone function
MAVFLQAVLVAVIWVLSGIGPRPVALLKGVFAAQALLVLVFQPFIIRKMQTQELEADAFAAGFAGAVAMKSALLGLASQNRGWAPSHLLYTLWYEAHPPVLKRLEALEEIGLSGK